MNSNIDILSIGDIVTDNFIRLFDDKAEIIKQGDKNLLAMEFGTKIPFQNSVLIEAVGNAANAAVSISKLGLSSALVSNVGSDDYGRDMIKALDKNHVLTHFVKINHDKKSNYHFVLWYKEERTILIKHEEYSYRWPHIVEHEIPRWVYFSSISEHSIDYHHEVVDWLEKYDHVKLAFQPGTFQLQFGPEKLKKIYERTDVLIVNREEAVTISGGNYEDFHDLFNKLHSIGPKMVVITDGPNGAYASDGVKRLKMPVYPDIAPPYERTGAGDAFASTFISALANGEDMEGALMWAPINSMSVVQKVGAQEGLLSKRELQDYLNKAPDWYRPSNI